MTQKLQPVRGTHDLLPAQSRLFRHIVNEALSVAGRYGYGEIMTPIFEFSEVFHRTLGDTSDVVTKETYSFTDRGGESLTLRPEFTAAIARAFISGAMTNDLPLRFFYSGPAFRYERPQKGRQRQFHQIGVELLGVAEPLGDVESIALAAHVLDTLGLRDIVTLELNTLGDAESRAAYREALVAYFTGHVDRLSEDSQNRLARNPLRILDSKDEGDRTVMLEAPRMEEFLTGNAKNYFAEVKDGLDALGITYRLNEKLVRGLDYYNHTVFEFTTSQLGAQGTVLAGGRYDGLIELMGGPATPGTGWAAGMERLMALMETRGTLLSAPRPIAVVPVGSAAEKAALPLAEALRMAGFSVDMAMRGNVGKRMKRADKIHAVAAVIFGDDELAAGKVLVRSLDHGVQEDVARDTLISALAPYKHKL